MDPALVAALVVVLVVLAADAWVYVDASALAAHSGSPSVSIGDAFAIDTPLGWLVACVLLFIVAFPMYLVARRSAQ